jgi:hypothetical protein
MINFRKNWSKDKFWYSIFKKSFHLAANQNNTIYSTVVIASYFFARRVPIVSCPGPDSARNSFIKIFIIILYSLRQKYIDDCTPSSLTAWTTTQIHNVAVGFGFICRA